MQLVKESGGIMELAGWARQTKRRVPGRQEGTCCTAECLCYKDPTWRRSSLSLTSAKDVVQTSSNVWLVPFATRPAYGCSTTRPTRHTTDRSSHWPEMRSHSS